MLDFAFSAFKTPMLGAFVLMSCTGSPVEEQEPEHGEETDVSQICNGSDEIRFAYRMDSFHLVADTSFIHTENGIHYVYIDGECEVWHYGLCEETEGYFPPLWCGVRRARWDQTQLETFVDLVEYSAWREKYDERGDTGSREYISFENSGEGFTLGFESEEYFEFADSWPETEDWLLENTAPSTQELPLRLAVQKIPPEDFALYEMKYQVDWPDGSSMNPAELALDQEPYCVGSTARVPDAEREKFHSLREAYLDNYRGGSWFVADFDGAKYEVRIRESIPFEDEFGLVKVGRFGDQFCAGGIGGPNPFAQ